MLEPLLQTGLLSLLEIDPQRVARVIRRLKLSIAPGMIVVFVLDLLTPLGIAIPMFYAAPVFLAGLLLSLEWSAAAAFLATVLTYLGSALTPDGGDAQFGHINRLIAAVLIWLALLIGWLLSHIQDQIKAFYDEHKGRT
jgi:hypothetical protein